MIRRSILRTVGAIGAVATAIALAACTPAPPVRVTGCAAPLGDPLDARQREVQGAVDAASAATADSAAWLTSNAYLYGGMPEYQGLQGAVDALAAAQAEASGTVNARPAFPAFGALTCGRVVGYADTGALSSAVAALAAARQAAETAAEGIRRQWAAERDAQLAIAAGFTSAPAPARFDVVASDEAHLNATLLAHHAANYAGTSYVMMRWSMGGRTFPGVGGLVRFTGSVTGLYRVTALLGEMSLADQSTHGPFHQAYTGLAFGAYDAAFQTSWGGSESRLRVWVLMRVGE